MTHRTDRRDRFGVVMAAASIGVSLGFGAASAWSGWLGVVVAGASFAALLLGYARFYERVELGVQRLEEVVRTRRGGSRRTWRLTRRVTAILVATSLLAAAGATLVSLANVWDRTPPTRHATSAQPPPRHRAPLEHASGLSAALEVANVTRGDKEYSPSVLARYDDVLKVQLTYGNKSREGKTLDDVSAIIHVPTAQPGDATVSGAVRYADVELRPTARIVLERPDARLSYIEGSLIWRRNTAGPGEAATYVDKALPDSRLLGGPLPLDNLRAGKDYEASLTILLRVQVSSLGIQVHVGRSRSSRAAATSAAIGDRIPVTVRVYNMGNTNLQGVEIWGALPEQLKLEPGGVVTRPDGPIDDAATRIHAAFSDQIPVAVGDLPPGGVATLQFDVRVQPGAKGARLEILGVSKAVAVGTYNNRAQVDVAA